jgi:hypothetical protein
MKLSELVALKNQLDAVSAQPIAQAADTELSKIGFVCDKLVPYFEESVHAVAIQQQEIAKKFTNYQAGLDDLGNQVKARILKLEKPMYQASYDIYAKESLVSMAYDEYFAGDQDAYIDDYGIKKLGKDPNRLKARDDHVRFILNRKLGLTDEVMDFFRSRIHRRSSWHHPGMIIRPGTESFVFNMVANDPLYILDESHDLLRPALESFNEIYANRLRPYVIEEKAELMSAGWLKNIPDAQFGFVLAYNYFNYKPFEVIKHWLEQLFDKLKPGGILAMTFNDCDRATAVALVEDQIACYTPGSLIKQLVQTIGFEISYEWPNTGPVGWIEITRPGQLQSLRGGQTLAKLHPKPQVLTEDELQAQQQHNLEELRYRALANGKNPEELVGLTEDQLEKMNLEIEQVRYKKKH